MGTARMLKENELLRNLMSQPLSIYFDAFRTEDYDIGGEEYLTFSGTRSNLGGGMDAKSGVFTVPQAGAYMFTIHICTHDMKKGLLSLRCNGNELASFYDQNHDRLIYWILIIMTLIDIALHHRLHNLFPPIAMS